MCAAPVSPQNHAENAMICAAPRAGTKKKQNQAQQRSLRCRNPTLTFAFVKTLDFTPP